MSLTLLVRSAESKEPPSLTFDADRVVIGRGPGCDVRLPDPSVSHRHASVRRQGREWVLVDEGSTNGTFVGGVRLAKGSPRPVKTGDLVRVGRVWLEVKIDQAPPTHDLSLATRDLALALVAGAMQALGDEVSPKVTVVEGPDAGAVLLLREEGRAYVVGRGESCDLPLADPDASREHVQIVRRAGSVLVRDRKSKNGARLGDTAVPDARDLPWKNNVLLFIGKTSLALEEPAAIALSELEQAADEEVRAEDVPAEPRPLTVAPEPEPAPESAAAPSTKAEAPIAQLPDAAPAQAAGRWTATDVAVIFAAIAIIGLSLAGLLWLLRS
jgi:pSer/pThr/pTyr-binding forkhead associated (FHA) protein